MPNLGVIPPATLSGQGVNKGSGIWWAIDGHSNCTPIPGGTRRSPPGTWSHATCHPPGKVSCSLPLHGSTLPQVHHVPAEPLRQRPCARRTGGCCVCSAIRPSPYSCPSQGQSPPFAIRCPRATPCLGMLALGGGQGGNWAMPGSVLGWVQVAPQPGTACLWERSWIPQIEYPHAHPIKSQQAEPGGAAAVSPRAAGAREPPDAIPSPTTPPPRASGGLRRAVLEGEPAATPAGLAGTMNHCWESGEEGGARGGEALARLREPPKRQGKHTHRRSRSPHGVRLVLPCLATRLDTSAPRHPAVRIAAVAPRPAVPSGTGSSVGAGVHASRSGEG